MQNVSVTRRIPLPSTLIWHILSDFNGLPTWHPAVSASQVDEEQEYGCVRELTMRQGGVIRERLLESDDTGQRLTYTLVEGPLPVTDYTGTMEVRPHDDGCLVTWTAAMTVLHDNPVPVLETLRTVFTTGLDGLAARLGVSARPA